MRNILNIDLSTSGICDGVQVSACSSNRVELNINVKDLNLINPYLYFVLDTQEYYQTEILTVENNEIVYKNIPENIFRRDGSLTVTLRADNYISEEIKINTIKFTDLDDLICKYIFGDFIFSLNKKIDSIFDKIYPIGSLYFSVINANPSEFFGGIWEQWGNGRVPVGVDTSQTEFNTVEKTGGEKTHKLTEGEMPEHYHRGLYYDNFNKGLTMNTGGGNGFNLTYGTTPTNYTEIDTGTRGGNQSHNNLQPYITCYMWKRIA